MNAHIDGSGVDAAAGLEPPHPGRSALPAPGVAESELPPPVVDPPWMPPSPLLPDEATLRTDETAIVSGDVAPIDRTTILRGPGGSGAQGGGGDRRLVRGSDDQPRPGESLAPSPSASSLPDRTMLPGGPIVPPAPPLIRPAEPGVGHAPTPPAASAPKPEAIERPISVPARREQSSTSRPVTAKPIPTHAPPMIIRRTRRRSGISVVLTLVVLGGLIAAAVVYGRPVLFPDGWSDEARPYGEAVEASLLIEFEDGPDISRLPTDAYQRGMLDRFGGNWRDDLPLWRSLGLASSTIDEGTLAGLIADWQPAYYDPDDTSIAVDVSATDVDAHIATAMAAAALDQRLDWSTRRDAAGLELRVLIDAQIRALARAASSQTPFGQADDTRPLGVATFLPSVLAYRIHGPLAYGDLVPGDVSAAEAIAPMSALGAAPEARPNDGDVVANTHATDRAFWYLVFAGYVGARRAYDGSNGMSLATLTTAQRGDATCTYATFSGAAPKQAAALASMLDDWVAAAPNEMSATSRTRPDGVLQLRTCDPGAGFVTGSRFGVARELVRWRLVELAVRERAAALGTDADAAIAEVRLSDAAAPLLRGDFEVSPQDERALARQIASDLLGG